MKRQLNDILPNHDDEDEPSPKKKHTTTRPSLIKKLISGGQTGADRAGLEAAESLGIETGGWAARGFQTTGGKDVSLKNRFHLKELVLPTKNGSGMPGSPLSLSLSLSHGA